MITLNKPLQDGIFGEMALLIKPGTNIKDILPNDQYLFWKEKYEKCLQGGHFIFEFSFHKKTHESTYEVSLNPIRDENGIIVGASTFCREITSRKQQESEKMKLIHTLTKSNKDLEDFAYIVSHNLRAPVARMGGLMQIFNENDATDPMNKFVFENLAKSAKELDEITHDLNAIVSVRSHTQEEKRHIALSTIFEEVKKSLQHELDLINAKVSFDFSAANELYAVKSYMYNIFRNLLVNSIKYRQLAQSLEVKVWTERKGTCVYLYFQDNGSGIDLEKNRQKVFGLYNRFHQHIKGKGIGLHIIKAQIEVMNCKINVKSEVNNGTCFDICFPANMVV
jgi:light-regulated signal transduction histidine kinase (bacteriophytochrome)